MANGFALDERTSSRETLRQTLGGDAPCRDDNDVTECSWFGGIITASMLRNTGRVFRIVMNERHTEPEPWTSSVSLCGLHIQAEVPRSAGRLKTSVAFYSMESRPPWTVRMWERDRLITTVELDDSSVQTAAPGSDRSGAAR